MSGIVIIGAGQAGSSLAIKLRALGYQGTVTLIGEEPYAPYQRPPPVKNLSIGGDGSGAPLFTTRRDLP